jgi:hypothetical protein
MKQWVQHKGKLMGPQTKTSFSRSPSANTHRPKPIWQNPMAETHQPKPFPAETHSREPLAETLRLKPSSAETHSRKTIRRNRLATTFLGRKPPWPKPKPKPSLAGTVLGRNLPAAFGRRDTHGKHGARPYSAMLAVGLVLPRASKLRLLENWIWPIGFGWHGEPNVKRFGKHARMRGRRAALRTQILSRYESGNHSRAGFLPRQAFCKRNAKSSFHLS